MYQSGQLTETDLWVLGPHKKCDCQERRTRRSLVRLQWLKGLINSRHAKPTNPNRRRGKRFIKEKVSRSEGNNLWFKGTGREKERQRLPGTLLLSSNSKEYTWTRRMSYWGPSYYRPLDTARGNSLLRVKRKTVDLYPYLNFCLHIHRPIIKGHTTVVKKFCFGIKD